MRYTVPTRNEDQKTESSRILHAAASEKELRRIQQALDWMIGCADGTNRYDENRSYRQLYDISKSLGITGRRKESDMYPRDARSEADFKEELNNLWRILQVYAEEKTPSLPDAYQKYIKNRDKYENAFRAHDRKLRQQRLAEGLPEPEPIDEDLPMALDEENEEELEQGPLLADEKSPYAHLIKGSVYSELHDLYKGLKPQLRPQSNLSDRLLQESMEQLLSKMQLHYLRRNQMGNMLPMTKDERREITELYQTCLRDCQRLSDKLKKKPEYKKLNSLLTTNEQQLRYFPKEELPPLADVIRSQNTPTINLVAQEKETIGRASSSREAVEYTDADGNIRRGFFTPERKLENADAELDGIIDKYERQYPKYSEYFKKIKDRKNNPEFQIMLDGTRDYYIFGHDVMEPIKPYFGEKSWISQQDKADPGFVNDVLIPMITELARSNNTQGLLRNSGFETNDLLAERANAMGDVARFLGYPELLVGTQMVTVKRGDRTETGVMMEPAGKDLVDPTKMTKDHPFYNLKTSDFNNSKFLASLADLQILDYLCANTDRHAKNFFLKMDLNDPEKPKLLGVQGIDNDNSFGGLNEGGIFKLAKGSNLKIITPKMAAAVSAMTQEQFQDILKPYHLTSAEMEAARERLMDLQDMIKQGKKQKSAPFRQKEGNVPGYDLVNAEGAIHIMKKDEWKKLTLDTLLPKNNEEKNIFNFANTHRRLIVEKENNEKLHQDLLDSLKKAKTQADKAEHVRMWNATYRDRKVDAEGQFLEPEQKEKEPEPLRFTKQADHVDYQKLAAMQKKELEGLEQMLGQFNAAKGSANDANRSKKFKAMRTALVELMDEYRTMRNNDPDEIRLDGLDEEELRRQKTRKMLREKKRDKNLRNSYEKIEAKRQTLKKAVDSYLNIYHWKLKPSENNRKRIDTAKQLSDLIMDAPSSGQFYKSSKALEKSIREKTKEDYQAQGRYLTNQIHSMMQNTLHDNVYALKTNDPLRKQGIQAIKAHERLWNYSQSKVSEESAGLKNTNTVWDEPVDLKVPDKNEKEKLSWKELLETANREKNQEKPDKDQLRTDLETIQTYAENSGFNLGTSIGSILEKGEITPREVGAVLSSLLVSGSQMAKERKEAAKVNAMEHANDINIVIKKG